MSRPRLFIFLLCFSLGLIAGELWRLPMIALFAGAACAIASLSGSKTRWVSVILLGSVLGIWRMQQTLVIAPNDISRYVVQTVTLEGDVVLPPSTSGTVQRFEMTNVAIGSEFMVGKVIISVPAIPIIPTASRVSINCALTELTPQSKLRQWSHGIHARCSTRYVEIAQRHLSSPRATLGRWQDKMLSYVRRHYNEPQASLLNGILIGNTDGMPERLDAAFQATGTTHIVALSGFNVTIIMAIVVAWLVKVVGRRWAWIPALLLLIAFVVMSGASASVVRAAIMAIIVQLGLFIGRPVSIGRLLAYTALAMAWANPLVVFHDLGFQLSFLATIGLVVLARPMGTIFPWMPKKLGWRENLATTLSAITMTQPLLLWRFGRLSTVAPLVNILVVPLIPLAMAIGSVSLLGMWLPWLAAVVVPVSDALLRLIIFFITTGASLPSAMVMLSPLANAVCGLVFVTITIFLLTRRNAQETHPA